MLSLMLQHLGHAELFVLGVADVSHSDRQCWPSQAILWVATGHHYGEICARNRFAGGRRTWRALDDSQMEFPLSCKELVACHPERGLDDHALRLLTEWLGGLNNG